MGVPMVTGPLMYYLETSPHYSFGRQLCACSIFLLILERSILSVGRLCRQAQGFRLCCNLFNWRTGVRVTRFCCSRPLTVATDMLKATLWRFSPQSVVKSAPISYYQSYFVMVKFVLMFDWDPFASFRVITWQKKVWQKNHFIGMRTCKVWLKGNK